jgi:hypothetical protein
LVPNLADKAAVTHVRSILADADNAVGRVADPLSWFSESGFIGCLAVAIILSRIGAN